MKKFAVAAVTAAVILAGAAPAYSSYGTGKRSSYGTGLLHHAHAVHANHARLLVR